MHFPIGSGSSPFTGSFDGNGHTIQNLCINAADDSFGLFGCIENATIKDLTITNADLSASGEYNGILTGKALGGIIQDCDVSGVIYAYSNVGGLIGYAFGTTVSRSGAQIEMNGYELMGGLIGVCGGAANVEDCYASGEIAVECFSAGLVGVIPYNSTPYFNRCYSMVNIIPVPGGTAEELFSCFGSNSYIDNASCYYYDNCYPCEDYSATAKSVTQLKTQSTFVNWDFDEVWNIDEGVSYPVLRHSDIDANDPNAPNAHTVSVELADDEEIVILLKAENIATFDGKVFALSYDEEKLQVVDFASHTRQSGSAVGVITGTPLTILFHTYGDLQFSFDKIVPNGKTWSGVMTAVKFIALEDGQTDLSLTVD